MRSRAFGAFFLGGALCWLAVLGRPRTAAADPRPGADGAPVVASGDTVHAAAAPAAPDTLARAAPPAAAPGGEAPRLPEWRRQKSPRTAMIASFGFPGLGQLYNERPFWAAVAAGVEFYFIGRWAEEQRLTNRYREMFNADPTDKDAQVLYELHRDDRIQAQWLLVLTILLSGAQSYVDAALADFDMTPLPLRLAPETSAGRTGLALQWRF